MRFRIYADMYYENYHDENCPDQEEVLPYMVLIHDHSKREKFKSFLESDGFSCMDWNDQYPGVLVNTRFKRFRLIHRPCRFPCVKSHDYTINEFMDKIYNSENG